MPAADERLAPDKLIPAIEASRRAGSAALDDAVYRWYVIPRSARACSSARARLLPLLDAAAALGPGPGRHVQPLQARSRSTSRSAASTRASLIGAADFPSIFDQRPREGMHLHWDGNNTSLAERNSRPRSAPA